MHNLLGAVRRWHNVHRTVKQVALAVRTCSLITLYNRFLFIPFVWRRSHLGHCCLNMSLGALEYPTSCCIYSRSSTLHIFAWSVVLHVALHKLARSKGCHERELTSEHTASDDGSQKLSIFPSWVTIRTLDTKQDQTCGLWSKTSATPNSAYLRMDRLRRQISVTKYRIQSNHRYKSTRNK